jgi:hypothetical protein
MVVVAMVVVVVVVVLLVVVLLVVVVLDEVVVGLLCGVGGVLVHAAATSARLATIPVTTSFLWPPRDLHAVTAAPPTDEGCHLHLAA